MGSYLFDIVKSIVFLVEVDQPSKTSGVGGDDVVLAFFGFGRNVASVRNVLDAQRRLQFDLVSFLLE